MPPLPSEWLRDIGFAEFAPSATNTIAEYSYAWAVRHGVESHHQNPFQMFIEFGAVEFALMPLYRGSQASDRDHMFPVRVTDRAAADAIYKTDCGPFMEHVWKEQHQLRPWDVFAFAGDMSKAELFGFSESVNELAEPENMRHLLEQLAERYSHAGLGDRVVNSGLLAAQGLVWIAKLAVLRGEDYAERGLSMLGGFRDFGSSGFSAPAF